MPNRRKWFDDKSKGMDGLMLGSIMHQRYRYFDACSKGIIQCWVKNRVLKTNLIHEQILYLPNSVLRRTH